MKSSRQSRCIFVVSNTMQLLVYYVHVVAILDFMTKEDWGEEKEQPQGQLLERICFFANKYGAFNMVITRKKKNTSAANENACNAGNMKSTC